MIDSLFTKFRKERVNEDEKEIISVRDRPIKSILKAVSWRIVGSIDTMFISFLLTGKLHIAISIGSIEVFTKIFLFYLHERIWNSLQWGQMKLFIQRSSFFRRKVSKKIILTPVNKINLQ